MSAVPAETTAHLKLGVFAPETTQPTLCSFVRQTHLLPARGRTGDLQARALEDDRSFFLGREGRALLTTANTAFEEAIKYYFNLERANGFYRDQLTSVNTQVESLVAKFCSAEQQRDLQLPGEVQFAPRPAQLLQAFVSPDTDPRTRYELGRQVALAIISGELNAKSTEVADKLADVHYALVYDLFGPQEAKKKQKVYALHDNDTNEVKWISSVNDDVDPGDIYNTHIKEHTTRTRFIEGIGDVEYDSRIKGPSGVIKAVRKAMLNAGKGGSDEIKSLEFVPDIMGMRFVVKDAFSSDDPKVEALMKLVKESLKDNFGLEDKDFKDKNTTNGSKFQGKFQGKRLMVTFPEMGNIPLEIMFHGLGDHFNNTYNLGRENPETNTRDNFQSHELMEVERDVSVLRILFPASIYEPIDWDEIIKNKKDEVVVSLMAANRVPADTMNVQLIRSGDKYRISLAAA